MKLGVYVGSFNPVHKGHIKIINHLLDKNYLDKVLVIPTGNYWNKNDLEDIKHRINMLKFYENQNIIIDDIHNNILYTYEILRDLSLDNDNLYLILGADNIIDFSKWKNYEELLYYKFLIINRDNIKVEDYLKKIGKTFLYTIVNDLDIIPISSTYIREKIVNKDFSCLCNYIDKDVFNYINENKLYIKKKSVKKSKNK